MEQLKKLITCPYCDTEVEVHWGSFLGCGKRCPDCGRVIRAGVGTSKVYKI